VVAVDTWARMGRAQSYRQIVRGHAATAKGWADARLRPSRLQEVGARRRCRWVPVTTDSPRAEASAKSPGRWSRPFDSETQRRRPARQPPSPGGRLGRLRPAPLGQHVVADLMAFLFPQQRGERHQLQRGHQQRSLPDDRRSRRESPSQRLRADRFSVSALYVVVARTALPSEEPDEGSRNDSRISVEGYSGVIAERCPRLRPGVRIAVSSTGGEVDLRRAESRRAIRPARDSTTGEHPWRATYIEDRGQRHHLDDEAGQAAWALHWGGACNRFSEEELRLTSILRLATDWADRVGGSWSSTMRSRAPAERQRRAEPASRRSTIGRHIPRTDSAVVQPPDVKIVGGEERIRFSTRADGAQLTPCRGSGADAASTTLRRVCHQRARYALIFTFKQFGCAEEDRVARFLGA